METGSKENLFISNMTNKYCFSKLNAEWLSLDEYNKDPDSYSVTEILKPIRAILLYRKYKDKIIFDVSERIFLRIGQAIHRDRERVNTLFAKHGKIIGRVSMPFPNGMKLSGELDSIEDGHIIDDLKVTTVWGFENDVRSDDYINQLSMYRLLYSTIGLDADTGRISYFLRDWVWSRHHKKIPTQLMEVEYPLMSIGATKMFVTDRLAEIYKALSSKNLPECTDEERWKNNARCKKYCDARSVCSFALNTFGGNEDE